MLTYPSLDLAHHPRPRPVVSGTAVGRVDRQTDLVVEADGEGEPEEQVGEVALEAVVAGQEERVVVLLEHHVGRLLSPASGRSELEPSQRYVYTFSARYADDLMTMWIV